MSDIILQNIRLNDQQRDIVISGELISAITPAFAADAEGAETIDCTMKAAVPTFVNMHTHAAMALMRGEGEGLSLQKWLEHIWRLEAKEDADYIYWGTKAAVLEMIKTGTATFNDHYWFPAEAYRAAVEMGIRPCISYTILDRFDDNLSSKQKEECIKTYEDSLTWPDGGIFDIGLHAIYTVSEEMILWATEFARKHNLMVHMHVSETRKEVEDCMQKHGGLSPVEYLDRLGVLDNKFVAAHTLWLSDKDIEILGRRKVNCVHNINSNTKLASGYKFKSSELKDAGANVCLGTDGCASSNNLDMLEAMKTTALIQKAWREDCSAMPTSELIDIATLNGANALGINSGKIEVGRIADINIIDMDNTYFMSNGFFRSNLVYSAHSDCISSMLCRGRFVMKDRKVDSEREILDNARRVLSKVQ